MTLRSELSIINDYNRTIVQDGAEPIICNRCWGVMLHYVNTQDIVYFQCTACNHTMFPGRAFFRMLEKRMEDDG